MAGRRRWTRSSEPEMLTASGFLALPPQPDGTTVRVLYDDVNGIYFTFRFRAASPSPYKWECVGFSDYIVSTVAGASGVTGTGSAFADLSGGPGPDILTPLAGDYVIDYAALGYHPTTAPSILNFGVGITGSGGPGTQPAMSASGGSPGGNCYGSIVGFGRLNGLAAGLIVRMRYLYTAIATLTYAARTMRMRPVRVQGP